MLKSPTAKIMILKSTLPLVLFLLLSVRGQSQSDSLPSVNKTSSNLRIAYNSSLIYPGIKLGIEFPIYTVNLTKKSYEGKQKSIVKERFISGNAGWYHHESFHDNIYFTIEWTMRRTGKNGFFTEFSSGAGYSRTFLGEITYRVENNGEVDVFKLAGYNYAMIVAGGGFGYDFIRKKGISLSVFYKFDILTMFPYNSTIYFRPVMELGIIYKPANFIRILTITRRMTK
jgi:hypothetical protein